MSFNSKLDSECVFAIEWVFGEWKFGEWIRACCFAPVVIVAIFLIFSVWNALNDFKRDKLGPCVYQAELS